MIVVVFIVASLFTFVQEVLALAASCTQGKAYEREGIVQAARACRSHNIPSMANVDCRCKPSVPVCFLSCGEAVTASASYRLRGRLDGDAVMAFANGFSARISKRSASNHEWLCINY